MDGLVAMDISCRFIKCEEKKRKENWYHDKFLSFCRSSKVRGITANRVFLKWTRVIKSWSSMSTLSLVMGTVSQAGLHYGLMYMLYAGRSPPSFLQYNTYLLNRI